MKANQLKLIRREDPAVNAVLGLIGEWIRDESRVAVSSGQGDSARAHQCGRAEAMFDLRERIQQQCDENSKVK